MSDRDKNRGQLLEEVKTLRRQMADLEQSSEEYQKAFTELQNKEQYYRMIADNSHDWEFWLNADERLIYTSPSCKRFTGYNQEDFIKNQNLLFKIIHPDDRALFDEHRRMIQKTKSAGEEEFRIVRKDGKTLWISHVCQPVYDEDGQYAGIRASNRDISKNKIIEETAQEDDIRHRLVAENIGDMTWMMDSKMRLTYISPSVEPLRGYTIEEAIGQTIEEILTPASIDLANNLWQEEAALRHSGDAARKRSRIIELEFICRDGSTVWTESSITPIRDAKGQIIELLGVSRDATERRNTEKMFQESDSRLKQKERQLQDGDKQFQEITKKLQESEQQLQARDRQLKESEKQVQTTDNLLQDNQKELLEIRRQLQESEQRLQARDRQLKESEKQSQTRDNLLQDSQKELLENRKQLQERESRLRISEDKLRKNEIQLREIGNALLQNEMQLQESRKQLQARENLAQDSEKELQESQIRLEECESELQEIGNAMLQNEKHLQDIRHQQASELQTQEGKNQLLALLNASTESIVLTDIDGSILFANEATAKRLGTDLETLLNKKNVYHFIPQDVAQNRRQRAMEVLKTAKPVRFEDECLGRAILNSIYPVIGEDGQAHRLAIFGMDITEQEKAKDDLRESEEYYRSLFEKNHVNMLIIDPGSQAIVDANHAACAYYGWSREELVSKKISDINVLTPDEINAQIDAARAQKRKYFIFRHRLADGSIRDVEVFSEPLHLHGRALLYTMVYDITERKRMENALTHTAKLESLGILAGGIAHDFNNLMTIVQGYIDLAILGIPTDHMVQKWLKSAQQSLDKTRGLTSQLITFSQGGQPVLKISRIDNLLRDAVKNTLKSSSIQKSVELQKGLWPAEFDEGQIRQCFCNLAENAGEAMPNGGAMKVRAENVEVTEADGLPLEEGTYLRIVFEDSGTGISPEHLDKVFDPYFTTKEMGQDKGMGLGLTVCYSVLKKHGGHIAVSAGGGGGTAFSLYLPAKPDHASDDHSEEDKVFVSSRRTDFHHG